ncbi:hypothetical protein AJ79_04873 [Helicocarpus griseus UAMH5409]|uniref:Uncharacterized protein n=1 Tax=Helicocarpus griseus UAMH5409 TaxID=1447875 RepID=A0A2B7XSC6_9EURO|nr:hypothetical protein AJ79_04873 [Helicocarpus griseus UAMH5409]
MSSPTRVFFQNPDSGVCGSGSASGANLNLNSVPLAQIQPSATFMRLQLSKIIRISIYAPTKVDIQMESDMAELEFGPFLLCSIATANERP